MCPPGVFCLSTGLILCIILFICIGAALVMKSPPTIIMQQPSQPQIVTNTSVQSDGRFNQAPQPLRDWMSQPEFPPRGGLTSMPVNIPTQGLPESFQSTGIIKVGEQILPLYGRRTAGSNDRWNYYTRTDTFNPVPIPLRIKRRNCMDDVGCPELMSGEHITVDALNKEGQVEIYRFDGPKYIPGLL
jgi:hypothetical protein